MNRITALVLALVCAVCFCSCRPDAVTDTPELGEIAEYSQEQLDEKLIGLSIEEIHHSWGEPDGHLSGFWGEIWSLDGENDRIIVIYYDENGIVEYVNKPAE